MYHMYRLLPCGKYKLLFNFHIEKIQGISRYPVSHIYYIRHFTWWELWMTDPCKLEYFNLIRKEIE